MEGKIRKKLIALGDYPFASLHPLEGAAAQLSSHRRVGDFWRPAFGGRYRSGDALSGANPDLNVGSVLLDSPLTNPRSSPLDFSRPSRNRVHR
jgi:hypothetical protein